MLSSRNKKSAEEYAQYTIDFQQKMFSDLLSTINIDPNSKCLDIGCGSGNSTRVLAEKVGPLGHITGIDPDEKRIEVATKVSNRDNVEYILGKSIDIPTNENYYDVIVSSFVMHWIPRDERIETYQKIGKVLKKGGIYLSIEANAITVLFDTFFQYANHEDKAKAYDAVRIMKTEESQQVFEQLDFKIERIENVCIDQTYPSIDFFCDLATATMHGSIDFREIYESKKEEIDIRINEDGTVVDPWNMNFIIVRKK